MGYVIFIKLCIYLMISYTFRTLYRYSVIIIINTNVGYE